MKCLNEVSQTIEINCTWMFSTFYIYVTSCFSMNIRYREGSLPHNFTKSYKKSFQCLSFKVQVPLSIKKVIQNATKKIEFMERENQERTHTNKNG